ncbi:MAG TPA: SGNH/GDSL hydrolase family protein, partial [Ilumatobacteraceae bacterium]|nr:SGNH/GDSL hydrolase family protein [Ilumatobacteraceae bacterium]
EMRRRAVLVTFSLVASLTAALLPGAPAAAAPAGCRNNGSGITEFCDQHIGTVGPRGAIGLLGDSVLLGSASGMSTPSLPTMLSNNGFGPVHLSTTLGMTTFNSSASKRDASAFHWLTRWRDAGFSPSIIVVNLGANHLGTCTPSSVDVCLARIEQLLREVAATFPTTTVWWAKVVQRSFPSGAATAGMTGWNTALDRAASRWPNLIVWDWPTALATANPPIVTDVAGIHPNSSAQYVKRSTLMAEHITTRMSSARFDGRRGALPAADTSGLGFAPVTETTIYSTLANGVRFAAGETRDIDLSAEPAVDDSAQALALTVSAKNSADAGWLVVFRCGDPMPPTSNVNFAAGAFRTAQAVTKITGTGHICVHTSTATDVIVSIQGNFLPAGGAALHPISPVRPLDTRNTGRARDLVVAVPGGEVLAASATLTVTGPSAGGTITVHACDPVVPAVANLSFEPNETVAGAAFVPVSAAGTICVHIDTADTALVDVIVDITGTFSAGPGGLRLVPVFGTRLLDTRTGTGGWVGRHGTGQALDVVAAPPGARAVTGTITIAHAVFDGYLTAYPCGEALPPTSSVNARAGLVMANSVTVGVNPQQQTMCIFGFKNTDTLFDVVGWWVEATS